MSKDYIQLSAGLSQEIKDSVNIKNILESMSVLVEKQEKPCQIEKKAI